MSRQALRAATAKLMPPGVQYELIVRNQPADGESRAPGVRLVHTSALPQDVPVHGFDLALHSVIPLPAAAGRGRDGRAGRARGHAAHPDARLRCAVLRRSRWCSSGYS